MNHETLLYNYYIHTSQARSSYKHHQDLYFEPTFSLIYQWAVRNQNNYVLHPFTKSIFEVLKNHISSLTTFKQPDNRKIKSSFGGITQNKTF